MTTEDELKEKYEQCQSTEDYAAVAVGAAEIGNKEWAEELIDEGADWAEAAEDFIHLAKGVTQALGDKERAGQYLLQAKDYCMNLAEFISLANSAAELEHKDKAEEIFTAAQGKCTKVAEFVELGANINKMLYGFGPFPDKSIINKCGQRQKQPNDKYSP